MTSTLNENVLASIDEITSSNSLFSLWFDPPFQDFTTVYEGDMILSSPDKQIAVPLNHKPQTTFRYLVRCIQGKEILTWDIKRFCSYLNYHYPNIKLPECKIIDLKYGLAFLGQRNTKSPIIFADAESIAGRFIKNKQWERLNEVIYNPLATKIIPNLETKGILSGELAAYSWYEIDSQVNGRMTTHKVSDKYITPHSLTPEQNAVFASRSGEPHIFVVFDYAHMEVAVLQWLSGDKKLSEILESKADFYKALYESVFKETCSSNDKRQLAKGMFLPIMYGLQSKNLAEKLKISQSEAETIIANQAKCFPEATSWLEEKQKKLSEDPIAIDYYGKHRDFSNEPPYKRLNFEIQSPAAMICLERLCALHNEFAKNMIFSIHDGYTLVFPKDKYLVPDIKQVKAILETPSDFSPGLKMQVSVKAGNKLSELKILNIK